jgi:hypothetical protein
MANEFKIKNGYLSEGNSQITGSLNVSAGITGSLFGTSSYAVQALSASYVSTTVASASYATSASYALSASFATTSLTASYVNPLTQSVNILGNTATIGSASFSYAGFASNQTYIRINPDQFNSQIIFNDFDGGIGSRGGVLEMSTYKSRLTYGSYNWFYIGSSTNPYIFYIKDGTGNVIISNGSAAPTDAGYKFDVQGTARVKGTGTTSATTALTVQNANASSSLVVLDNGFVGINTGSAQYNLDVNGTARVSGTFTGNTVVSIADMACGNKLYNNNFYVENTGATNIGAGQSTATPSAILQANSTTRGFLPPRTNLTSNISSPAQGLITYITGSGNGGEGLYYYNSGSLIGWHKILSNSGSQSITGSLNVTSGITGSLLGTSSYATQALSASYASVAQTLLGSVTSASYALTASYVNPLNQNVTVTGSLVIVGDLNFIPGATRYISMSAPATTAAGNSIVMKAGNATTSGTGGSLFFQVGAGTGGPGDGTIEIGNQGASSIWPSINLSGPTTIYSSGPNTGTSLTINGGGQTAMRFDWDNINLVTTAVSSASRILRFSGASQYQVRGSGTTSATTAFTVQNANASASLTVKDDGSNTILSSAESGLTVQHTNGNYTTILNGNGSSLASGQMGMYFNGSPIWSWNGSQLRLPGNALSTAQNAATMQILGGYGGSTVGSSIRLASNTYNGGVWTATSGTQTTVEIGNGSNETWSPSSGNATYNLLNILPRINTSGTYSGIVRGFYYSPTLTSITGVTHRAIETTAGDIIFGGNTKVSVTGSLSITGSAGTGSALYTYKSGSTVVDIQGSQGQLFSITDALSGSLMSVNDVSGLPILEVFSDDRVVMGTYGAPALTVTGSTLIATGSLLGTASYATTALSASYAPSTPAFPYTGSALITGSLGVTGSLNTSGSVIITNGLLQQTSTGDGSFIKKVGNNNHNRIFSVLNTDSTNTTFGLGIATYSDGGSNRYIEIFGESTTGNSLQGNWGVGGILYINGSVSSNYHSNLLLRQEYSNNADTGILLYNNNNSYRTMFWRDGNVSIADSSYSTSSQVLARLFVKGLGTTSATTAFLVQNSAGTTTFQTRDDGVSIAYGQQLWVGKADTGEIAFSNEATGLDKRFSIGFQTATMYIQGTFGGNKGNIAISRDTSQVGFASGPPVTSAQVQIDSTTRGFLPPRTNLTSNISTPAQGLMTYITGSTNGGEGLYYYNSGSLIGWHKILSNSGSQSITGSLNVTSGITGSLLGTASYTTQALSASYAPPSPAFPFTGSARITGSLNVIGATVMTGSLELSGSFITYDESNIQSIQANTSRRTLYDNSGNSSVDWLARNLNTPSVNTALDWSDDTILNSNVYQRDFKSTTIQNAVSNTINNSFVSYLGDIIEVDATYTFINSGVTDGMLVYLDIDATWYPVSQNSTTATKMLGIAFNVNAGLNTGFVLLEGHVVIDDTLVQSPDHGLPIYIRDNTTTGQMSTIVPVLTGGSHVVRVLGHCYWNNSGAPTQWMMKFRPSNDWILI